MGLKEQKAKDLKKIPGDLVSYVTMEGEAVKTDNDKYMIVSYAEGKLKTINWYIDLIRCESKNYIVPHTLEYLVGYKAQLEAAVRVIKDRPLPSKSGPLGINYPSGYEG